MPHAELALFPRIIPVRKTVDLKIRIAGGPLFTQRQGNLLCQALPCTVYAMGLFESGPIANRDHVLPLKYDPNADVFRLQVNCPAEQEYRLRIRSAADGQDLVVAELSFYALEDDLFGRRPYKGDLHMHSNRSDGRDSPAHVAAACRRIGFDFMAVTDHRQYDPSIEARDAFRELPVDLAILPGEEIHAPSNPVHIVNFGGKSSINAMFQDPSYEAAVDRIRRGLDLPDGVDPFVYASTFWIFDQIRRVGGLGIFCHPYWLSYSPDQAQAAYISEALTSCLLERRPFDALELLGGYHRHEVEANILQVTRYSAELARGLPLPIVGVSDAHGCETGKLFGWYYTVVFARSLDLPDLIGAVKDSFSVAVEALPGETVRVYGPFRLVKLALFLLREVFPEHDRLCAGEGSLMQSWIGEHPHGQATDRQEILARLQQAQGRCAAWLDQVFARP
ncbi:MAG: hypothetical protein PHN53_00525 [Eubacteriales bacterium]|nr:hypothetical protein [Eubacteriales bacterium]